MAKPCCSGSDQPACCPPEAGAVTLGVSRVVAIDLHDPSEGDDPAFCGATVPLTELRVGQSAVVRTVDLSDDDAAMLRAMGVRSEVRVRLCRIGRPCIIEIMGGSSLTPEAAEGCPRGGGCTCRIGLAAPLAARVLVSVG